MNLSTNERNGVTDVGEVDRIKALVRTLAFNAKVRLHLRDGSTVLGIVAVPPTVQTFRDAQGNEGIDGTVKLEDPQQPGWDGLVRLNDIESVEHLDSVTMDANKA